MITSVELFKAKKFPKWISSNPLFKEIKQINKIFPSLGLQNFCEDYLLDNGKEATIAAKDLLTSIRAQIDKRKAGLEKFKEKKLSEKKLLVVNDLISQLNSISNLIDLKDLDSLLTKTKAGQLTLNLPADVIIADKRPTFKKGERLFRVLTKINSELLDSKLNAMPALETTNAFKVFSNKNIPIKKFKIAFSSDGADGLWDIATMSMRGVRSCQSWDGQYKQCLVGSMLDPFVGIIYLTSDAKYNDYGSQMIKRCIVRFAIDEKTREKFLLLDNMYPNFEQEICDAFISVLKHKTNNKIKVEYANYSGKLNQLYMPLTEIRKKIGSSENKEAQYESNASYQDFHIKSKTSVSKDAKAILFEKNADKKIKHFHKTFHKALTEALSSLNDGTVPDVIKPIINKLNGKTPGSKKTINTYYGTRDIWSYKDITKQISNLLVKEAIQLVDKKNFNNSDTYLRRIYFNYLTRNNELFDKVKNRLSRELTGKLDLKKKVKSEHIQLLLNQFSPTLNSILKADLKDLSSKRKEKFSGAAPLPE